MAVADEPEICSEKFEEPEKGSQSKWIFECGAANGILHTRWIQPWLRHYLLKPLLVQ
jgi:hypothetical protein